MMSPLLGVKRMLSKPQVQWSEPHRKGSYAKIYEFFVTWHRTGLVLGLGIEAVIKMGVCSFGLVANLTLRCFCFE